MLQQNQISKLSDELKNLSFKMEAQKSTKNVNVFDDQYQELQLYKNQYNSIYDALRSDEILIAEST